MSLDDPETGYNKAVMELNQLAELLRNGKPKDEPGGKLLGEVKPLFAKEEFCTMVEKAKHHIHEGDIFKIVLSNRLSAPFEGSPLNTYRVLRTINPSPYMFYFSGTDVEVAGASPETLVKLENGVLHTFPLAGTRPRGKTVCWKPSFSLTKKSLPNTICWSTLAETISVRSADLVPYRSRNCTPLNDSSTSCTSVPQCAVRSAKTRDALDAIEAVLPAGTLSGAPKIRACQLIGELENNKRGIYGGAIGYIDFTGNMDTCIAIRIAYRKNGKVFVRSGAGIVNVSSMESRGKLFREKVFPEPLSKSFKLEKW